MKLLSLTTLLFISLWISGCSTKEVQVEYRDRYLARPLYDFKIVDIDGAKIPIYYAYIDSPTVRIGVNAYKEKVPNYEIRLAPQDVADVCTPYLKKAKGFYMPILDFYEYQILDYKEKNK